MFRREPRKGKHERGRNGYQGENREDFYGKRQKVTKIFSNGDGMETTGVEENGEHNSHFPCMENLGGGSNYQFPCMEKKWLSKIRRDRWT